MPEEDCPSCNDHAPGVARGMQGEPVRGVEDVFAYVPPIPDDAAGSPWPTADEGARVELLSGIPEPPPEMAPTPKTAPNHPTNEFPGMEPVTPPAPPQIHDNILDAMPQTTVEYLPRLGAPWFQPPTPSRAGLLQADENGGQGTEDEEEVEVRPKREDPVGDPETYEDYDVTEPPPGESEPRISPGDEEDFRAFWDHWKHRRPPADPDQLSCPSSFRHKIELRWTTEKVVASDEDKQTAEDLAIGALAALDIEKRHESVVESGALEAQIKDHLENDLNWKCDPECHLEVEIVARHYSLTIHFQLRLIVNQTTLESRWDVVEVSTHVLRAVFDVRCVT